VTRRAATNLDKLAKALDKAKAKASNLDAANAKIGAVLVEVAKLRAPHDTGQLRNLLRFSVRQAKATRDGSRGAVTASVSTPYAAPIHYGWPARNIRPQKFLAVSLDKLDRSGKIGEIYTDAIAQAFRDIR